MQALYLDSSFSLIGGHIGMLLGVSYRNSIVRAVYVIEEDRVFTCQIENNILANNDKRICGGDSSEQSTISFSA